MKPADYAKKHDLGGYALARLLGVSPSLGCLLIKGTRRVSPILAREIDMRTNGGISVHDLRPDVFGPPPARSRRRPRRNEIVDNLSTQSQARSAGER